MGGAHRGVSGRGTQRSEWEGYTEEGVGGVHRRGSGRGTQKREWEGYTEE